MIKSLKLVLFCEDKTWAEWNVGGNKVSTGEPTGYLTSKFNR